MVKGSAAPAAADSDGSEKGNDSDGVSETQKTLRQPLRLKDAPGLRPFFARNIAEHGKAMGKGEAVLAILKCRGLDLPDDARETITSRREPMVLDAIVLCDESYLLDAALDRAVTIKHVDELFECDDA